MNANRQPHFRKRALAVACAAAVCPFTTAALAQETTDEPRGTIKVEVTGSRIARAEVESALPIQVITREEIERGNWTTASALMAHVSANFNGMNNQLSITSGERPGLESANLRGLGDGNTLVLLNGRRLSNYAFLSGTVNLNAIPIAAIERVEILKDGASSIYGTDAVAGVVNFITRKDYAGIAVTGQAGATQQGGGDTYQASVTAGWGDLTKDRVNAFVVVDWQKETAIPANKRSFAVTYLPAEGIDSLNPVALPANVRLGPGALANPEYAKGCAPPVSVPAPPDFLPLCLFDPASVTDIAPPAERWTVLGRAIWQVTPQDQLFAEYLYARTQLKLSFTPTPVSRFTTLDQTPVLYPADGPYYPAEWAASYGVSGPLEVFYRTNPLGARYDEVTTEAQRLVVGATGTVGAWSYGAGYNHSVNTSEDFYTRGWVLSSRMVPAMATGLINPWGASAPLGQSLLESTQFTGTVRNAKGTLDQFDIQASRDVVQLPNGPLALAIGGDWRREKLEDNPAPILDTGDVMGAGGEISPQSASRTVGAAFVEVLVPLAKSLEIDAALRYDHYSDFGATTNPKVSLRWQPVRSLLLRGAWGTGFRAPTLVDLYTQQYAATEIFIEDPVRCPVTDLPEDCNFGEYQVLRGGNPALQPETSTQYTAGFVWDVTRTLSLGIEWWKIEKQNVILALSPTYIVDNEAAFGDQVIRGPADPNYSTLPGPIETIVAWNQNIGSLSTSGFDVSIKVRTPPSWLGRFQFGLDGTYVRTFTEELPGLAPTEAVGRNVVYGAVPRWRHYASLNWQNGPWSATLGQTYQHGYVDALPNGDGEPRRVGSYGLWDLQGVYSGFANTSIALGVNNLFNTDPPLSNAGNWGFDQAYADPRGRTFYARLTYTFR